MAERRLVLVAAIAPMTDCREDQYDDVTDWEIPVRPPIQAGAK